MELQLALQRAAVRAATAMIIDNALHVDVTQHVRDAFVSLFDTEITDWPEAAQHLERTADLALDLANFGFAVQGGRNV